MRVAPLLRSARHARRYRTITTVFLRHGFGFAYDELKPEWRPRRRRFRERRESRTDLASADLAAHFRQALEELGPTFVKLGQLLSTRPDILPPTYIAELSKLHDTVPPVPWEGIREVIVEALGGPPETVFATLDEQPLAAASLAQVHAATLGSGENVVLKVQRPAIERVIAVDLEILAAVAGAIEDTSLGEIYDLVSVVDDFAVSLRNELDYELEGRNADRFRENFENDPHLYVPRIHWQHSSRRLLVMERIYGIKIDDIAALDAAGYDRHRIALNAVRIIIKEILEDGFFHADPHPGNLLVRSSEQIGVMDFGMVGWLSDSERLNLIRLYLAVANMDAESMVDLFVQMGAAEAGVDRQGLSRDVQRLLARYRNALLKDVRARDLLDEVLPVVYRHRLRLPANLWQLAKTIGVMEGVGLRLDPDLEVFGIFEGYAQRLSWHLLLPRREWGHQVLRQGARWGELLNTLPRSGTRLLQQAEAGELFQLRLKDAAQLIKRLDRLVTRLSLTLLVSALVVSLALIVPTIATVSSMQVPVAIGFGLAAGLGAWLFISILRGTR